MTRSSADHLSQQGYLTVNQLADYLKSYPTKKVSYPTLMRIVKDGQIDSYMVGKQIRILEASIRKYIEDTNTLDNSKGGSANAPSIPTG